MVLKTFNVQEEVHRKFSDFCKERGVSMSKQIEWFMESMISEDNEVRKEYLDKLDRRMREYEISENLKNILKKLSKRDKKQYSQIINKIEEVINSSNPHHYKIKECDEGIQTNSYWTFCINI